MDYEKIYNEAYIKAHIEIENYIKEFLTAEENSINFFSENYKKIIYKYRDDYKEDKYNRIEPFVDIHVEFTKGKQKIKKDSINNIFKFKILPLFKEKKELFNYTFEQLIHEIAIFEAKIEAFRILTNNYNLFEMIYESEDYSRFEIKDYEEVLETTDTFIYYEKIVFPHKYETKNEVNLKVSTPFQPTYSPNSNEEKEIVQLTTKEMALLIYFYNKVLKENKDIPLTELYKCLSLINVMPPEFYQNKFSYKGNVIYKILSGQFEDVNIDNLSRINKKDKTNLLVVLNDFNQKLSPLKMINITKEIKLIIDALKATN